MLNLHKALLQFEYHLLIKWSKHLISQAFERIYGSRFGNNNW